MEYLEKVFNLKIKYSEWDKTKHVPFYLLGLYQIKKAAFNNTQMLFLSPKYDLPALTAVKKHIERLQEIENLPVVLVLNNMDYKLRRYLLRADIPFIVNNTQIYLPFLGTLLTERYNGTAKVLKKLQPSAQQLLLYIIYYKKQQCSITEAALALEVSEMTISKAIRQLIQTQLFHIKKEGLKKLLVPDYDFKELYDKAQGYLINPVKKVVYIAKKTKKQNMPLAGYSALAERSMLAPPSVECYAAFKEPPDSTYMLVTPQQCELEIWKYNPAIFAEHNLVDVLSLALQFTDTEDPRTEDAVETMLNKFWEEYYGTGIG